MSAFSRGFAGLHQHLRLPSSLRVALFAARTQPLYPRTTTRLFTSSLRNNVSPYGAVKSRPPPRTNAFVSTDPVLRMVQINKQPVLLYRQGKRQLYNLWIYAFASMLVGSGLYTLKWRYELPKDLPGFVGPTYVVIAAIFMGLGFWVFSIPVSRCVSIEAIPNAFRHNGPVQLRIRTRIIPLQVLEKEILASPSELALDEKLFPVKRELLEADRARNQSITQGLENTWITSRFWIVFGRLIEQKWTSFFLYFKYAIDRFGHVKVEVQDRKWIIDCRGYLREDGKALDRILRDANAKLKWFKD